MTMSRGSFLLLLILVLDQVSGAAGQGPALSGLVRDATGALVVSVEVPKQDVVSLGHAQGIVFAPGAYVVRLVLPDGSERETSVTIRAGERARVDL